jgi:predicted membrane channel-forming protein YqfA (hemolysin III family)
MNARLKRVITVYLAANALTFVVLLLTFLVMLFMLGDGRAQGVWSVEIYTIVFFICLIIAAKFVKP